MSARIVAGFDTAQAMVSAASALHQMGFRLIDARTPYPLNELKGLVLEEEPRGVARACLVGGLAGAVTGVAFQVWANAVDWPLNVGGKPLPAWLSYVPAGFEFAILCAGVATFGAFIVAQRRVRRTHDLDAITQHRFALEATTEVDRDAVAAREIFHNLGAAQIVELGAVRSQPGSLNSPSRHFWLRAALVTVIIVSLLLSWVMWPDATRPNLAYAPDMAASPAIGVYELSSASTRDGSTRAPPSGAIARGARPFHYGATEAEALRAGAELSAPAREDGPLELQARQALFTTFCQPCHGKEGHGDGATIKRGFQPPPSLLTQHARDMKDGQMFHVLTYGQKLMPPHAAQLAVEDRWRVIAYVRDLQQRLPVDPPPFGSAPTPEASP